VLKLTIRSIVLGGVLGLLAVSVTPPIARAQTLCKLCYLDLDTWRCVPAGASAGGMTCWVDANGCHLANPCDFYLKGDVDPDGSVGKKSGRMRTQKPSGKLPPLRFALEAQRELRDGYIRGCHDVILERTILPEVATKLRKGTSVVII